ncbi:hypothetical protein MBLNU459_g0382t1 [Dothideomycetes sp. NU459]
MQGDPDACWECRKASRVRRRAARILQSREELVWASEDRNESITETRTYYERVLSRGSESPDRWWPRKNGDEEEMEDAQWGSGVPPAAPSPPPAASTSAPNAASSSRLPPEASSSCSKPPPPAPSPPPAHEPRDSRQKVKGKGRERPSIFEASAAMRDLGHD